MPLDVVTEELGYFDVVIRVIKEPERNDFGWVYHHYDPVDFGSEYVRDRMKVLQNISSPILLHLDVDPAVAGEELVLSYPDPRDDHFGVKGVRLHVSSEMSVLL